MNKRFFSTTGLLLALALFIGVNVLAGTTLRFVRADLTENSLFTLSDGTKNILDTLEEPVTLRFYFSKTLSEDYPGLQAYAQRVQELLEEYQRHGDDMLRLEVIEPESFSEEEDRAVAFGLQGQRVNQAGDRFFFGLAGTNTVDDERVIPFFDQGREEFLEYDLTEMVYGLSTADRTVVGILSSLPMQGQPTQPGRPPQPWPIVQTLGGTFEIRHLTPQSIQAIDEDVDVLMLVHPKGWPASALYAVDQFVMRGGNVLAFADTFCAVDPGSPADQQNPMMAPKNSDLGALADSWGVELVAGKIAGDREAAEQGFLVLLEMRQDHLNGDDAVTGALGHVRVYAGGVLRAKAGATTSFEPLLQTGTESQEVDTFAIQFQTDPEALLNNFVASGERLCVAARLSGPAQSAFPGGDPAAATNGEEGAPEPEPESLTSTDSINIIVVSDADMLHEQIWTQRSIFGLVPVCDNSDFVANALENLGGNDDLISLRSRGRFQRPFDKKLELEREADDEFREKEVELEAKLRETERQLNELQQGKEQSGVFILSPEQQETLAQFREEQLATRKELREVKHQLQKRIESLGSLLKFINIGMVPMLLAVGALLIGLLRSKKS